MNEDRKLKDRGTRERKTKLSAPSEKIGGRDGGRKSEEGMMERRN